MFRGYSSERDSDMWVSSACWARKCISVLSVWSVEDLMWTGGCAIIIVVVGRGANSFVICRGILPLDCTSLSEYPSRRKAEIYTLLLSPICSFPIEKLRPVTPIKSTKMASVAGRGTGCEIKSKGYDETHRIGPMVRCKVFV